MNRCGIGGPLQHWKKWPLDFRLEPDGDCNCGAVGFVEDAAARSRQAVMPTVRKVSGVSACGNDGSKMFTVTYGAVGTSPDVDESLTLEQTQDRRWGDPPADATRLIETEQRLKPVSVMDTEDLVVPLPQHEAFDVLVPVAPTCVEQDPLAEGDLNPGDLRAAVLREQLWIRPCAVSSPAAP